MEMHAEGTQPDADEWELRHDESSGQAYYVNLRTGESSWEPPGISALPSDSSASAHRQWTEAVDETGRVYYMNLETMETSWEPPPGFYTAVSARATGGPNSVEDTLMRRPSTAEQMEQLNALLSGGDGDEEGDEEEQLPGSTVIDAVSAHEAASVITEASDGSEWMMFLNETDGIPYYYNHITGECVWEPPAAFLEYHLKHSEADQSHESHYPEHDANGEPTELRVITTPAPHPPMSPPPASPRAQSPVPITPEFEEKVRRAIETVSKTPVGSSRLLFVRTPTVKSIEGVSSSCVGSRPASSSNRSSSRPSSSTGTARQRVATAMALVDGEQTSSVADGEVPAIDNATPGEDVIEGSETILSEVVQTSEDPVIVQDGGGVEINEELNEELQRHDEMMQELLFDETALMIQCLIRCFVARRRVARKRQERQLAGQVFSSGEAVPEDPEPVQSLADQEAANQDAPPSGVLLEPQAPELCGADVDVNINQQLPNQAESKEATHEVVDSTIQLAPHEDNTLQDATMETPEVESSTHEDQRHNIIAAEVGSEIEQTPIDGEVVVAEEENVQGSMETNHLEATASESMDNATSEPETDIQIIADDRDLVDIGDAATPVASEPDIVNNEPTSAHPISVDESKEDEFESSKSPDSLNPEALDRVDTSEDSPPVAELAAVEEPSPAPVVELQEARPIGDGVALSIGSENVAQATLEASTGKTPESTHRTARQAAKSGRRTERDRPGASSAPRSRDHHKANTDTSSGPLAVLNIASYFPVRALRERRAPPSPESKAAIQKPSHPTDGIIRKPIPTQPIALSVEVKTEEQRHLERIARSAAKDKERQEAAAQWKQQVSRYQQAYAGSAARTAAERHRVLQAELQRREAAVAEKQEQSRKAAETKRAVTNRETNSLWEAPDNSKGGGFIDQIKVLQKAVCEPEDFVGMMMQERLRALKATLDHLQKENSQVKAAVWQQRVQSTPSSAAQLQECRDPYWARLHLKLQVLASSSSAQELTQQLAIHRSDSLDSLLHLAAWHGNAAAIQLLISELGFDVNAVDNSVSKTTPLHEASRGGHLDVVECLLACGAHLDAIDAHGETPLHVASRVGHSQVVHRLIAAGEAHQDPIDPTGLGVHVSVLRSLSWQQCVHWRNYKHRRAVDVVTLPSLKEFLTHYSRECQPQTDTCHANHESPSQSSSATSSAVKTNKLAVKKKKVKSVRPRSAAKSTSISMGTAAAALAVHARRKNSQNQALS